MYAPVPDPKHPGSVRLLSALFYALSSFFITMVNKTVLTSFRFPSYMCLGIGQIIVTLIVLYAAKAVKILKFPDFDWNILLKIFPLPLLYMGNYITGLASTKKLSLPMFTVLRKFTIIMTMALEVRLLRKTFPKPVVFSVITILVGGMVAASSDLAFDMGSYTFILLNDVFTAGYNVYTKKKLGIEGLGKYGILYYNSLIIVIPTILASEFTGDLHKAITFEGWTQGAFLFWFLLSCVMGFVLMYSIVLCSYYNSALTTTIVGAVKNVAVAFIGMFVGGDYLFSWMNFIGLTICMLGGLMYSYLTFTGNTSGSKTRETQIMQVDIAKDSLNKLPCQLNGLS